MALRQAFHVENKHELGWEAVYGAAPGFDILGAPPWATLAFWQKMTAMTAKLRYKNSKSLSNDSQ